MYIKGKKNGQTLGHQPKTEECHGPFLAAGLQHGYGKL
jgi:hypothetical protein